MTDAGWLARGRLRVRRDLTLVDSGGGTVVKDPLSLEYFRLGDRERFLLEELGEPLSVAELTRRYQKRFPNERATGEQVLAFCASLSDCSMLLSDQPAAPGARGKRPTGEAPWYAPFLSPLAIRLPGVDPTPLLNWTEPFGRVVFSKAFAVLLMVAAVIVGIGLLGRAEEVAQGAMQLAQLADPSYALLAAAAVVITKTWHELGHAVACRRMGAECHEVGVMLLAMLPCLYCDASDAWTLPSRWHRAVVALAGVYFEAILATAAAAAWLVLAPGPAQTLALFVVIAASVSTLLVNLNPLLRYDGYYVLADAWGVANLHQQSHAALWGPLTRWVRGDKTDPEPADASPWALAAYGAASVAYGWLILALILWTVYHGLDAAGFRSAGDVLVALSVGGLAVAGARSTFGLVPRGPSGRSLGTLGRMAVVAAVVLAGGAWVASLPIEQTLLAPCRLESESFAEVVARHPGTLQPRVRYGDYVEAGALLAELADPDADLRRLELLEREASLESQLTGLRTRSQRDASLLPEITRLEPSLAEVRRQLATHDEETERRRLRAPIAGLVTRPESRDGVTLEETAEGELPTWGGAPLDPANDGCLLEAGEPLCRVVGEGLRAVLLLDEDDSGLLRIGDPVRVLLDRTPADLLTGEVERVAAAAADGRLAEAERRLEESLRGPLEGGSAYRVSVRFDGPVGADAQPGAVGRARVVTGRETVGGWVVRRLRRLVRLG